MLYHYLDRRVGDLADDDVFTLSAIRAWVFATRNGRCVQVMLRSGFTARRVGDALLAFMCAMTLIDRHGYGTMRFASARHPLVSDDEARVLSLFAVARGDDPVLIRIASSLVGEDMAVQLAGAATRIGGAMRLRT